MGLLDEILGGIVRGQFGQAAGSRQVEATRQPPPQSSGGGLGGVLVALLPVVLEMLANRGGGPAVGRSGMAPGAGSGGGPFGDLGGLGGLLEQMQRMGMGAQAKSWVSTGPNESISPAALEQMLGRERLSQIAAQAGVSPSEVTEGLSELLPEVVDKVTPQGKMPDADALLASIDDLERRLGR